MILIIFICTSQAYAQSRRITWDQLGLVYADARFQLLYREYVDLNGEHVQPLGFSKFMVASDSLLDWIVVTMGLRENGSSLGPFQGEVHTWRLVSMEKRADWLAQYDSVQWSYLGNNFFTPLDTVATPEIRAHLQAYFGSPTQTATETKQGEPTPADENGQFEYWLAVNDSIPMMVMDVGGPFDRGIIVATDHQFRSLLYRMRQSLLATVMRRTDAVPYVDYYYSPIEERWYLTGYDGEEYFTHRIKQPDLKLGRPVQEIPQEQSSNKADV
ncbi:MAG: hypothetical protein OXF48_06995 [Bacteroidetes bacterium]|nr:hypothetical protein [Bacteroidota bacterium]